MISAVLANVQSFSCMSEEVIQEVDINADVTDVWNEIVEGVWLGEDVDMPLVEGGEGHVVEDGSRRLLIVEEVVEGRRIVFRWATFEDDPSRIAIDVMPVGDITRVVVVETPLVPTLRALALV
jgi:uncharacterized protein YndB with AHSA1/START domain